MQTTNEKMAHKGPILATNCMSVTSKRKKNIKTTDYYKAASLFIQLQKKVGSRTITLYSPCFLLEHLEGSGGCTYTLQRKLVNVALSCDSSGSVQSSFSYVLPDFAVFQVIIGGGSGASFGGGGAAAASAPGVGAAAAEAPVADEEKEEKEEKKLVQRLYSFLLVHLSNEIHHVCLPKTISQSQAVSSNKGSQKKVMRACDFSVNVISYQESSATDPKKFHPGVVSTILHFIINWLEHSSANNHDDLMRYSIIQSKLGKLKTQPLITNQKIEKKET
ncbi:hypothetical protein E3N88_13398 [Mikania micrantha]|uniref:Uncharacterized protein n=1 Tax=Mikania micrantha TaxID=192012 RepID=A0A5N6P9L6_9ASTR|nr:hypothetical protein E3N88_13398 [Mikania micrantha]